MSDWIEWSGGECPLPPDAAKVETRYRGDDGEAAAEVMAAEQARELRWAHTGSLGDILAYRVLSYRAPAPCKPSNPKDAVGVKKAPMSTVSAPVMAEVGVAMLEGVAASSKPSNPKDIVGIRKAPMSTVPGPVLAELGVAMLEGAAKYGRHNYRAVGVRSSVYYDATMRHMIAWWEGEDTDPDSGLSHITKAIASLAVLRDAMLQGKVEDDRPPRAKPFYPALNDKAGGVLDKHADKAPHHYTLKD